MTSPAPCRRAAPCSPASLRICSARSARTAGGLSSATMRAIVVRGASAGAHDQPDHDPRDGRQPAGDRPRVGFARRRHHVRRRRLSRGQRRRQRIAARQRRCDRERRRRTPVRILRQAAQDHAFDRRIEIAHDRRRRRRPCRCRAAASDRRASSRRTRGVPVKISNRIRPSA